MRLKSWASLRSQISIIDINDKCVAVDKFWQRTPSINHYLHPDFVKDWPDPWTLLYDNLYCSYARALGIFYSLVMTDTKTIEIVEAKDDNSNEVVLVLVDNAKYVLNYWPDTVVNNHINDFAIIRTLDISPLYYKIGS